MPMPARNWCLRSVGISLDSRLSTLISFWPLLFRIIIAHHIRPQSPNLRWDGVPADHPITTAHRTLPSPRPSTVGEAPNPVWLQFVGANTWALLPNCSIHLHFQPFSSFSFRHSLSPPPLPPSPSSIVLSCPLPRPTTRCLRAYSEASHSRRPRADDSSAAECRAAGPWTFRVPI